MHFCLRGPCSGPLLQPLRSDVRILITFMVLAFHCLLNQYAQVYARSRRPQIPPSCSPCYSLSLVIKLQPQHLRPSQTHTHTISKLLRPSQHHTQFRLRRTNNLSNFIFFRVYHPFRFFSRRLTGYTISCAAFVLFNGLL